MMEIKKAEVLRYLGYKNQIISIELNTIIDKIICETKKYLTPRYVYKIYDIEHNKEGVLVKGTDAILYGNDIKNHLSNCSKCIFMAATLGSEIEKKIIAKQINSVNEAFIMDACATVAIEQFCDDIEAIIKSMLKIDDCAINYRYSPGYGDFSIEFQPTFLSLLDAGKSIGLYATNTNILTPRKSVTAIIGIFNDSEDEALERKNKCEFCKNKERCIYRKNEG